MATTSSVECGCHAIQDCHPGCSLPGPRAGQRIHAGPHGQGHHLGPVAGAELRAMRARWLSTVSADRLSSSPSSLFRPAVGDEAQHLHLTRGQLAGQALARPGATPQADGEQRGDRGVGVDAAVEDVPQTVGEGTGTS